MRILHVTPSYYPAIQFGGPIQSVHLLNKALRQQGVAVDVVTTNAGLEHLADFPLQTWQQVDGVPVQYYPYRGYVHYNFSPPLWKDLFRQVEKYDLVHITAVWNFPVLAAAWACQQKKIPYIISPRGTLYPETISLRSASVKKSYLWLLARNYLNRAAAIHFTAEDEKQKVLRYLGLKSPALIIPNGLELHDASDDAATLTTSLPPNLVGKKYILFLGRLHPKKGLDLLIEAFNALHAKFPEYWLVLAGPDNDGYGDTIKGWIAHKPIHDKVIFTGVLSGLIKKAVFKAAALFVLPSYSENFGMSVIEAMACNTPVVISKAVGISAEVEACQAGIVTDTTPASVEKGIYTAITNTTLRAQLTANAKSMVKANFEITTVATMFKEAYHTYGN